MSFIVSDPRSWTKFGKVVEGKAKGNTLSFKGEEETVTVDFGSDAKLDGFVSFKDKNVVYVKPTQTTRETNEDKTRTTKQTWQVLYGDTTSEFFTVERTYPEYVTTVNEIKTVVA